MTLCINIVYDRLFSIVVSSLVDNTQERLAMSRRSRLPDSLRWRMIECMKTGLLQADAARRLDVSRNVVERLWSRLQQKILHLEILFWTANELQHLRQLSRSLGRQNESHYYTACFRSFYLFMVLRCEDAFTILVSM